MWSPKLIWCGMYVSRKQAFVIRLFVLPGWREEKGTGCDSMRSNAVQFHAFTSMIAIGVGNGAGFFCSFIIFSLSLSELVN